MERSKNGHTTNGRTAIEDQTRHDVRPLGAYVIKTEGPVAKA